MDADLLPLDGPQNETSGDAARPLMSLSPRQVARVEHVDASIGDTARLCAMGLCQGRRLQLIQGGDPAIVRVLGTRIGLSARLAAAVYVRPCNAEHCHNSQTRRAGTP